MERLAGRVVLLWGWRRSCVAFLAGAIAVLALPPFDFPAVCFVSFTLLVWLMDGAAGDRRPGLWGRVSAPFWTGWWFGFGYFLAGLWWVGNALLVEAESFAWALPLAVLVLPAGLAVFYGLAGALASRLWTDDAGRIAALAAAFGFVEWLRSFVFTGFPWNAIGQTAMPLPMMMQSVSVIGLYGMSAVAVFVFAAPALLGSRGSRKGLVLAALLAGLHLGFGAWRLSTAPEPNEEAVLRARIVQAAIPQAAKWDAEGRDAIFQAHLDLTALPSEGDPPSVVIWPETSVPYLLTDRPQALARIGGAISDGQILLAGVVRAEGGSTTGTDARFYNSVAAVDAKGEIIDASDKLHLVPFGEYLPLEPLLTRIGLTKIVETPISFSAGASRRLIELPGGITALPLICYEVIFDQLSEEPARLADVIVNVTNDAWFGNTPGPYQHFRQAQIRAVETGLPLLRAANNGISGGIDSHGRIVDAFAIDARGALDVALPLEKAPSILPWPSRISGLVIIFALAVGAAMLRLHGNRRTN